MKRMINYVKGKRDEKRDRIVSSNICVEITNPLGQKVPSEDEHIIGLQSGYGYEVDLSGRDKSMTKLHKATWQGNLEKVKLHLKKFDINAIDECNRTPLHLAAAQGHTNVVCFLLNNKAIPDICDNDGMTPFLKAVECGVKECVGVLVERGVNISATDNNGNTALHITAKQGFFNIMSMLLKNGANCNSANNAGEMALHIATEQEHRDLVEVLLQAGAHVNVVDRDNRTPLMLAARVGQSSLVSLLLKYGGHLDACDNNGWTAEDYAMVGGHEQLALELKVPQSAPSLPEPDIEEVDMIVAFNNLSQDTSALPEESEVPPDPEADPESIKPSLKSPPYSALAMEEEAQESPRSCVTPPPLNPPRSWEIIQAGMIDQTQVRRRSLMALGTLESHRESFVENGNGLESLENPFLLEPSTANNMNQGPVSDTEWDSDDSLPLDRSLPPPPELPDSSLESNLPLPEFNLTPDSSLPHIPEFTLTPDSSLPHVPELIITPDRRSRITLERTPSLDLTDSEIMDSRKGSADETLGRDGTMKGAEEIWEYNNTLKTNSNINNNILSGDNDSTVNDTGQVESDLLTKENANELQNHVIVTTEIRNFNQNHKESKNGVRESHSLDNLDECGSKSSEMESCQSCDRLDSERFSGAYSLDTDATTHDAEFTQSLDSLEEESMVGTVVKRNIFHESHSLELLEEAKKPSRHHARNKSMSVSSYHWSKSVDVLSKPCNADSACMDSQRIDAQLQCYDEALRELAEEQKVKQNIIYRVLEMKPLPKPNLNPNGSCDFVEPRVSMNFKPCTSTGQRGTVSLKSNFYGNSLEGSSYSNQPKEQYKHVKKSNTIDTFNPKFDYQERTSKNKPRVPTSLSVDNYSISRHQMQRIDLDHDDTSVTDKHLPPSLQAPSCSKQKSYKQRSSSTSSKGTKGPFDSKHKFYNSLELPPRYKQGKESRNESNISGVEWKRSLTVSSMPERQNEGSASFDLAQTNYNQSEFIIKSRQSPKPPPRVKKSLKKEKSDGDIKKRNEEKGAVKKKVGRSISLYGEHVKCLDLAKKQVIENKQQCFSEKSESDSDWSERPLHNKRKQFLAMRGIVADSEDSAEEDPPFWLSTGKDGCFSRQDTVIHNQYATTSNGMKNDSDGEKSAEGNEEVTSSSDTGSASLSHSEATPSQSFVLKSHQSLLKDHLKQATEEKARLEEVAAKLKEQTERLQYDLADVNQTLIVRDDKILILQDELSRLSAKYSASLDELNMLKQRLTSAEIELKHLREITRINLEKEHSKSDLSNQQLLKQLHEANKARKRVELEKETLIAQHIMDIKKLQQDTIHWKNLYEDAVSKLEQIEVLCDPCLMENNQHLDKVKSAFKKFRDEKNSGRYKIKTSVPTDTGCIEKCSNLELPQKDDELKKDVCFVDDTLVDNQVATLQLQLQQEKSRSSALENQVQKMLLDLQTKLDLETELEDLNRRLEKEFVPRVELEQLRANQETAIGRIRQQALIESETKLNAKLTEINQILQLQLQEQTQKERQRELVEIQMKQEFENTRQKLLLELSRVQAALKAKESEERVLREQCEAMALEAEKSQELKRRQLIEKSYSVNLADPTTTGWSRREKELTAKQSVIPPPPPPPPLAPTPLDVNLFSANSLRQQLERSISKHRDIQLSLVSGDRLPSPPSRSQQ